jgi:hypothetical protein
MSMKGKFVRWSHADEQGEFSYVGECIGDSKTMMILMTDRGEMLLDKTEGAFDVARKPKNWAAGSAGAAPKEAREKPAATKAEKKAPAKRKAAPKAAKAPKAGSKIAQAVAILSAADRANLTRQQMIGMLKEQMGIDDHIKASGLYQSAIKKVA